MKHRVLMMLKLRAIGAYKDKLKKSIQAQIPSTVEINFPTH